MIEDLRHAVRMMRHAKGWTLVVVLSLALGIGTNAALFSAVNGLLFETLPVEDPGSLVRLRWAGRNQMLTGRSEYGPTESIDGEPVGTTVSDTVFRQLQNDTRTLTALAAAASYGQMNLVVDAQADLARGVIVSGSLFPMLGVSPVRGRTIVPADDTPTAEPVMLIGHQYWQSRFGGDPEVVGRIVQLNAVPVTIVGVVPAPFAGILRPVDEPPDVWIPLALEDRVAPFQSRLGSATTWWLTLLGRMRPGATPQRVQGELDGIFQAAAQDGFATYFSGLDDQGRARLGPDPRTAVPRLLVDSGSRGIYDAAREERLMAAILAGVVGLVLLIVCANVASLLLSRAATRERELAIRRSLGASRLRLIRQMLTESLLLAALGGTLGALVAHLLPRALPAGFAGSELARSLTSDAIVLNRQALLFVIGLTTVTGLLFGLAPAIRASGAIDETLKEGSRALVGTRSVLARTLLVVQVAISLVLLVGAGLFLRTVENLSRVDVGFDPTNLALFRVFPQLNRYEPSRIPLLYDSLAAEVQTVPGVRSVGFANTALLAGNVNITSVYVEGRADTESQNLHRLVVSPTFLEALAVPVVLGRGLTDHDAADAPRVVLVNQTAARRLFPDESPLGRRIGLQRGGPRDIEIVGVAADTKYASIRDEAPPTVFIPYQQTTLPQAQFVVRTAGDPLTAIGALREAVRRVDSGLPMIGVSTQTDQIGNRYQRERLFAGAYTTFGGVAVALAAIGLFGLMSYTVTRRTSEIGIRMALGATPGRVMWHVIRESMTLVLIGAIVGIAAALGAGRLVASQLYEVAPFDPVTMALATLALFSVGALAAALPARRAAQVDAMEALRGD